MSAEIGSVLKSGASGSGLGVTGGGKLTLSGMNTYTGLTYIGANTTLALDNQGRVNASSGVEVVGTFDVSAASSAQVKNLTGSGSVVLGSAGLWITAANGTFSGTMSGGGLNVAGTKLVLTGANTLTSAGTSAGATLQIGDGGTTGSVGGSITNHGTVIFNRTDDLTFTGVINSAGSFQHIGGGKLILTGGGQNSSSGTGSVLISNNGTLQFGDGAVSSWLGGSSGSITIEAGSTLISNMANVNAYHWSGKLAGAGDFFKRGSSTITLRGDSSAFAGETFVNAGMLNVGYKGNGKLAGPVTVDSGARFGGSGTVIGNVTIASGATHAVGDTANPAASGLVHTQTINGNYVNRGTLEIEASPSSADELTVNGTVNIANATLNLKLTPNDPSPAGGWNPLNGPFVIIANNSTDAVTGTFASVGNLNNLLFLNHLVSYTGGDGNDVTLELSRNDLSVEEVAESSNQSAVGGAVDSLPTSNPVRSALLLSTDEEEARDALDELAGDVHASVSGGTTQTSQFLGEFANDRVRSAFGDVAAPDLPVMGYGEGGLELVAADTDRFVVWGQALGNWGSFDGDGNSGGFKHSSGGLVAGGDTIVGDGWRLGLLGGYSRTSFDTDDGAASGDSDNFHVGVYGGRHFGAVALRAGASYTRHAIDTSRTVSFPGLTETLKASYDAGTAQAFVETGYKVEMGRVAFEPFAGLAYVSTSTDGFTETGGSAALTSADKSFDSTTTTLGLRAASDVNLGDAKATVRGGLGWRHAFGDVTPASTVAFAAGGDSFTVHGAPIARDALLIEAGLDFAISPKANLAFSYNGQVANGARDHGVKASLGVKF
ncbi:autotransporter domain-containing protein [Aminobacter aminovorans]|uniref:autotransporter outer membrane beta-barrel domain-containing protein n=1 Tax=Aminobacter aminovorans TaxID=83263 RepID=UPI0028542C78|nr:autotransporter domain-containing protein [Aminobacter aminovorans]MDR7221548.1 outer membrane autotransporter protein [Aminobacter aminovorans]